MDFGDIDLAGTGQFAVATQGDVLQGDQPITGNVTAQVANLRVIGATPDLNVALAKMAIDATGTYSGGTTKLDQPATVSLQQVTLKKPSGQTILNDENIDVAIAGIVNSSPQDTGANLSTLSVTTGSDLLRVQVPQGQRLQLQVGENGSFQGDGTLAIGADLARLSQIGQSFAGPAPATQPGESIDQIESGRLDGTIHFARADRQPMTNVVGDFNITNLTMGEYLQNEKIAIGVRAEAPDALDSLQASANVNSSFAKIDVADARLLLTTQSGNEARAASVWEMIQHATVNVDAPNLEKVYALVGSAMPAATQPVETLAGGDEGQAASLPPLRLTKGAATAKVEIARESATTKLDVSELRATGVVLRRGDNRWALPRDRAIDLALAANLETSGQDISAINVTQLNGDLGVARLAMSQPISIQNPAGNFAASGAFELTGALGDLAPLLKTLQGSEFPYRGEYVVRQTLATQGDLVKLAGAINASGFKVLDGADVIFSEEQLAIDNDVSVDPGKQIANISKLTLAMKSSNAVNLAANGTINDWDDRRQFKDVTINLSYDLAELWKIIYPMLAPETQESLKTLQVAGQDKTQFTIFGSFPGSQPTNEAIQSLDVQGGFPIELIDYDGIHIGDLNPTFRLRGGVFRFTKDVVASFNGGKLDLSRIEADLRQDEPRVTFAKNHPLVRSATINPLLGKTIGQYVNPVFANATRARGQLDVTIDYCENLALSETIKTKDSGRMKASFALLDMDIANPLGSLVLGKLAELPLVGSAIQPQGLDVFSGSIRRAVVTVENGQTTQDITMEIIDPKAAERAQQVVGSEKPAVPVYPLRFQGDVNLSSLAQSLTMTIPPGLLDKWGGSDLLKVFPNGLPLSLGGTTLAPEVKLGDIGQAILKGQLQQNIGGGGGDAGKNALEDLLNKTLGGKDEKSAEPKPPGGAGAGEESRSADEPDEKRAGRAEEKPREKSRQQRDNAERP